MPPYTKYISKDYVIKGSLLELDKYKSWEKIDKRMRTAIRKARTFQPVIKQVEGNNEDVKAFYQFCPPNREDLPPELDKNRQWLFFAYINDVIVGGIIVTAVDGNLFMHFNAVTSEGRAKQISSLLIWHIVETFHNSKKYKYLDVGASYKPALQAYFSGWATGKYPVIMRPPEYKPQITITPFDNAAMVVLSDNTFDVYSFLSNKFHGREYTFFPRGMYVIYSLFKWFQLQGVMTDSDEVYISTTTDSPYISSCVISAIEQTSKWSRAINSRTKVVFVIHEFGFFNDKVVGLKKYCQENNIILVEDCAYAWQSGQAGNFGDYVIYSLSKFFPLQFGAFLAGKKFDYKYVWDTFGCADLGKEEKCLKELSGYGSQVEHFMQKRIDNYRYLENIFSPDKSFFNLKAGEVPGAFVLKVESEERMKEISAFVRTFGIECGNYYYNNAIYLPVHQNLERSHLDYMAGAVKAMYREGCGL